MLAVAAWRRFDRGVVLFHEGEADGSLHVLMRGRVAVRVMTPDGVFDGGPVAVTQEEIATMAGTTRPTVNRVMQDLAEAGIVELATGRFTVADSAAPWPARPAEHPYGSRMPRCSL